MRVVPPYKDIQSRIVRRESKRHMILKSLNRADMTKPLDRSKCLRYCAAHTGADGDILPLLNDPVWCGLRPGLREKGRQELLASRPDLARAETARTASVVLQKVASPGAVAATLHHRSPATSDRLRSLEDRIVQLESDLVASQFEAKAAQEELKVSTIAISFEYLTGDGVDHCPSLTNLDAIALQKLILTLQVCNASEAYRRMGGNTAIASMENATVMVLIYIKTAPTHLELARMFGAYKHLSPNRRKTEVSKTLKYARTILHSVLNHTVALPQSKEECLDLKRRSTWFKGPEYDMFRNVGQVDDCTTCQAHSPNNVGGKYSMYSTYKHYAGYKFNVTIGANLLPKWVSVCFGARASDPRIQQHPDSKWLARAATPGTDSMGDRGTNADGLARINGGKYFQPAFLRNGVLSPAEVAASEGIAQARSHIERVIGIARQCRLLRLPLHVENFATIDEYVFIAVMCIHFRNFSKDVQSSTTAEM